MLRWGSRSVVGKDPRPYVWGIMAWRHSWSAPFIYVLHPPEGGPLHVIRQQCKACGTRRNPITLVITHYGSSICRDRPNVADVDWSKEVEEMKNELAWLKESGYPADAYHGEKPARWRG